MKINMYTVFDSAVKAFVQPFFQITDGAAVRLFQDQVNNSDSNISKHPDQFTLFRVGSYDDSSALLIPETPVSLGNGTQYIVSDSVISGDRINSLFLAIQRIEEGLSRDGLR